MTNPGRRGRASLTPESVESYEESGRILTALRTLLESHQRAELLLSKIASNQSTIAKAVLSEVQMLHQGSQVTSHMSSQVTTHMTGQSSHWSKHFSDGCRADSLHTAESPPTPPMSDFRWNTKGMTTDFSEFPSAGLHGKLALAEIAVGQKNILKPGEAKAWLEANPGMLFLDVQDPGNPTLPEVYRTSIGQLLLCVSGDNHESRDPAIADRDRDDPILVTCATGEQAKLGAQILLDYGFTNVRTVEGGNKAWRTYFTAHPCRLPASWPTSISRRHSFALAASEPNGPAAVFERPDEENPQSLFTKSGTTSLTEASVVSERESSRKRGFILKPSSTFRISLDLFSVFILLYDIVLIPWILAWEVQLHGALRVMAVIMAAFWTFDIFVNFHTGFYVHGELRLKPRDIARRYLKTWFVPDVAMVVLDWFSLLLLVVEDLGGDSSSEDHSTVNVRILGILRFTKWSRVLRLFSLARFVRFSDLFERILDRSYFSPRVLIGFQVIRLIFFVAYINHLGACIWWAMGKHGYSKSGRRWVDLYVQGWDTNDATTYRDSDSFYQYVACLHWAMTQILAGSMQIIATNEYEHLFTVFCLIFGVLFLSSLVSTLAAKVMQLRMLHQERNMKLEQLRSFLQRKCVPADLAVTVIKQVEGTLKERKPAALMQLQAWDIMSERNRTRLHLELCKPHMQRHPLLALFSNVDARLIKNICEQAITIGVYSQHQTIFRAGSEALQALFVIGGTLKYTQEPETSMVKAEMGQKVTKGDPEIICEATLWSQWSHVGTLEVVSACETLELKGQQLSEALHQNPSISRVAGEYCRLFHARLQNAKPPYADWPSDLLVPYTAYSDLVPVMSEKVRSFIGLLAMQTSHKPFTPSHFRLKHEVKVCRAVALTTPSGELETVTSSVSLHLEHPDGRILAQLGVWNGVAPIPSFGLPSTRLQPGEMPKDAYVRLLRTQLHPFMMASKLKACERTSETKVDKHVNCRTTIVKHYAAFIQGKLAQPPMAATNIEATPPPPIWHVSSMLSGQLSSCTSCCSYFDEVYVIAGETEKVRKDWESNPDFQTELRLLAWMEPNKLDHLDSLQGRAQLNRVLGGIIVSDEAARAANESFNDSRWSDAGSINSPIRISNAEYQLRLNLRTDVV